jgi:hypothetical protein
MAKTSLEDINEKFVRELREVDDLAQIVLKGHLVMEGLLTEAIETFLLHGEFAETARLQMHQKINLCRGISTSDQNNKMWDLISSVNNLRNALSHSLAPDRREKAIQKLRIVYEQGFKDMPFAVKGIPKNIEKDFPADSALCLYAIAGCLGYLHAHLEEVRRLKSIIVDLDALMNKSALLKS